MKGKIILVFLSFLLFNTVEAQQENNFLLGFEYSGLGLSFTGNNERKKGPYDMVGLNLQYNFGKPYSILMGFARRKIGGFGLDETFGDVDVRSVLKKEYMIGDVVTINPNFNVFSLGISLPTFGCKCIHQTLNYDFLWTKKSAIEIANPGEASVSKKLYRNMISGLRYSMQFKIAFPENNFRLYFGPSISYLGSTNFQTPTEANVRMGANMGVQYFLKKKGKTNKFLKSRNNKVAEKKY